MTDHPPGLDDPQRLQRPVPQRQAPLRRPPLGLPADMGLPGAVERGVDTAYTVIDAYLRRGQQAAQRLSPGALGAGAPLGGLGGLGGFGGLGGSGGLGGLGGNGLHGVGPMAGLGAGLQGGLPGGLAGALQDAVQGALPWGPAASSLAAPWLQLLRAWADAVATLGPLANRALGPGGGLAAGFTTPAGPAQGSGAPPAPAGNGAAPGASAAAPGASPGAPGGGAAPAAALAAASQANGPRAQVTIELVSRQSAEVSVTLAPGADLAALQADWQLDWQPDSQPGGQANGQMKGQVNGQANGHLNGHLNGQVTEPVNGQVNRPAQSPGQLTVYTEPGHVHLRVALQEPPLPGRHQASLIDSQGQAWGQVVISIAAPGSAQATPSAASGAALSPAGRPTAAH